ncbi:conserved Plasmodium protein, unknown function [Plasmodium ovale wallikeri]|uniref:Uncharacterized protein n=1 Tax=Plasmodium ovale wallikeri TaxID=864142 RepID=A0A1A9AJY8_PLAOA|nr:conserved Plasmodium protein, unknown function [Plasmodium ovale wallikeri]SBT56504.1 conserved Plasmodium protein, unknown function [Plasmodium ovale wallikeri]
MTTIRWVHRKEKNGEKKGEKRIISLSEIKERYIANGTKPRNNENTGRAKGVWTKSNITDKGVKKKKCISLYEKVQEKWKEENSGPNVNVYVNRKNFVEKKYQQGKTNYHLGQKEEIHGKTSFVSASLDNKNEEEEENKIKSSFFLIDKNGYAKKGKEISNDTHKDHININLDININWDNKHKDKGNYCSDIGTHLNENLGNNTIDWNKGQRKLNKNHVTLFGEEEETHVRKNHLCEYSMTRQGKGSKYGGDTHGVRFNFGNHIGGELRYGGEDTWEVEGNNRDQYRTKYNHSEDKEKTGRYRRDYLQGLTEKRNVHEGEYSHGEEKNGYQYGKINNFQGEAKTPYSNFKGKIEEKRRFHKERSDRGEHWKNEKQFAKKKSEDELRRGGAIPSEMFDTDNAEGLSYQIRGVCNDEKWPRQYLSNRRDVNKKSVIKSSNLLNEKILRIIGDYFLSFKKCSSVKHNRPVYKKYTKVGDEDGTPLVKRKKNPISRKTTEHYDKFNTSKLQLFTSSSEGNSSKRDTSGRGRETPYTNAWDGKNGEKEKRAEAIRGSDGTQKKGNKENMLSDRKKNPPNGADLPKRNSVGTDFGLPKCFFKRKALTNTLIDSFNDVDINDQRRKKKYMKFFVILLSIFLKKYMKRQMTTFFSILGSLRKRQEERRSIRKFINTRIYFLSLLEGVLSRRKRRIVEWFFCKLKAQGTLAWEANSIACGLANCDENVAFVPKPDVGDSYEGGDHCLCTVKDIKQEEKSEINTICNNSCFGKPKLFRTDDFAMFYNKKILKEKDEVFKECLLRSKSDALLDFLKTSKIKGYSKSVSNNFSESMSNDDMMSSTLVDRFFTATYNLNKNINKDAYRSKINLSCYENVLDDSYFIHTGVRHEHSEKNLGGILYTHFQKRENYENSTLNNSPLGSYTHAERNNISGEDTNSTGNVNGVSNIYRKHGNPGLREHADEEDENDKNCRIFFKNIKKQLKINYRETVNANGQMGKDLTISDLNSTVGISKNWEVFNQPSEHQRKIHRDSSLTSLNFLTHSDFAIINNFSANATK